MRQLRLDSAEGGGGGGILFEKNKFIFKYQTPRSSETCSCNKRMSLKPTLTPENWGPIYWRFMHMATLLHGKEWTPQIVQCLLSIIRCIPDAVCGRTAELFLEKNPLPMSKSEYLMENNLLGPFEWVNRFHNYVTSTKPSTTSARTVRRSAKRKGRMASDSGQKCVSLAASEIQTIQWLRLRDDPIAQQTPAYTPESPSPTKAPYV